MSLYPKIDDFSILLDNDCKRMLRRNSRKLIICEVLEKLNNGSKKETLFIDVNTNINNLTPSNSSDYINTNNSSISSISEKKIYEIVLNILGCNKI